MKRGQRIASNRSTGRPGALGVSDEVDVRVGRVAERCVVLGPGVRAVVWVAGCPLRCRECVVPELLDAAAGEPVAVSALARRLLSLSHLDGVTFSGGEPFAQAEALAALADRLRLGRPELSLMSYTGLAIERLRRRGTPAQRALLDRLDLLVDGPYLPDRHAALRWRGSTNQRLHVLSDRHPELRNAPDVSVGMTFEVTDGGALQWMGVPAARGFRPAFERALVEQGVLVPQAQERRA